MRDYKYGAFTNDQILEEKKWLRKQIYFLLLIVDRATADQYPYVDVPSAIRDVQLQLAGLNELLGYPREVVSAASLIEAALEEYGRDPFRFKIYRKLILDAGNEIIRDGEVDHAEP